MTDRSMRGGASFLPTAPTITLAGRHAATGVMLSASPAVASGANPFSANDMLAFPFALTAPVTNVAKGFWVNGSSVANNASMAIYNADFVKLVETASTGLSGASAPQAVTLTAKLSPGLYYCALAHDSATTNRFFRWSVATTGAGFWKMAGCWKQASVTLGSLPNPATPVACNNIAFPLFGLITRTVFDV